ncbi:MAG: sigma-70 family RNA polymerase sigma factor [bacterium]|nr:sigma-70 family RNA polymerase sigma factor [bacterium]
MVTMAVRPGGGSGKIRDRESLARPRAGRATIVERTRTASFVGRESRAAIVSEDDLQGQEGDPDRELVEQAQAELPYGTSAYNELVRKHSGRVYARSYGILRSTADAEEAVQDVFLAVFRNLPRFRFERPFVHWLNTVTLNACRMVLRKRASEQRKRKAAEEQAPPPERPEAPDVALRKLVLELLDALDPGTRVPLLLRYVEGYSYPELARELDLSESAVKMRVSRGTKKLKALYEARVGGEAAAFGRKRRGGA